MWLEQRCSQYIFILDLTSVDSSNWAKTTTRRDEKHLSLRFGTPYIRDLTANTIVYTLLSLVSNEVTVELPYNMIFLYYITYKMTMKNVRYRSADYELTKTLHSSPSQVSYGVSHVNILEKNDCVIKTLDSYYILLPAFGKWPSP